MEPRLALNFSSRAGNGLLGVGWQLSGLSTITRCARTAPQDGVKGSVTFASTDRFCLDGKHLVLVAGTYGAADSEYRTEIDTFTKVTAKGAAPGGGPAYFVVKTKAGLTMEFGHTADSSANVAQQIPAIVRLWALNKVSDAYGNTQTVTYTQPGEGEIYPDRIDYTSNTQTGLAAGNSVQFAYQSRTDVLSGLQVGRPYKTAKLLSSVTTKIGTTAVLTYSLTYEAGEGGRARLKKLSVCGAAGLCAPDITMGFKANGTGFFDEVLKLNTVDGLGDGTNWQALDLNGDGRTDLVHLPDAGTNYAVWLSGGDGKFTPTQRSTTVDKDFTRGTWYVLDVDGDGLADMVHIETLNSAPAVMVWRSLGNGTFEIKPSQLGSTDTQVWTGLWKVIDINGDGYADLAHMNDSGELCSWISNGDGSFTVSSFKSTVDTKPQEGEWEVLDINGDGLADLFHRHDMKYVWLSKGNGQFDVTQLFSSVDPTYADSDPGYWRQLDVNGDGLVDLVHLVCGTNATKSACIWTSRGDGQFNVTSFTTTVDTQVKVGAWMVLDSNGDGLLDLVHVPGLVSNGNYYTWYADGQGSFTVGQAAQSEDDCSQDCALVKTGDFQGNGLPGFVHVGRRGVISNWLLSASGKNIPSSISNGVGSQVSWSMRTLAQMLGSQYFKELPSDATATTIVPSEDVVSDVEINAGWAHSSAYLDIDQSTKYSYGSARLERNGRGFVGFQWKQAKNKNTGLVTRTYYRQDFPYIGFVDKVYNGDGTGANYWNNLGSVTNTYSCVHPNGLTACVAGANKRYFPYLSESVEKRVDLDGSPLPGSRTVHANPDAYGNLGTTSSYVLDSNGAATDYSKVVTNTYFNDATNWILGRLVKSVVASTGPTVPAVVVPGSGGLPDAPPPTVPSLTAVDFSGVSLGSSATKTSTLSNVNSVALSITVPNATSVTGADFSFVSTNCTSSLAPGASCTVSVKFQPTVRGARSGNLSVTVAGGLLTTTLSGTGLGSNVTVTNGASNLSATYGASPATGVVTYNNAGNQSAVLSMSGLSAPYSVSPTTCTAPAGGSCSVTVSMSTGGSYGSQGTQTLKAAGATNGDVLATVSGTINGGSVSVSANGASAITANYGGTAGTGTVTFKNAGNQAAALTFAGLTAPYSFSPSTCTAAANGGTCVVTVSMATNGSIGAQGNQTLTATAGNAGAAQATVSGTLLGSSVSVSSNQASALVATKGGANATGTVTFKNAGNQAASLSMSGLSAPYSVSPATCTAAANGGTCVVTVTMSSAGALGAQGTQTLKATGGSTGAVNATVAGTINGSSISVAVNNADTLSATKGGTSATGAVTFKNSGNVAATLTLDGLSGVYSVSPTSCSAAANGGTCTVTVTMATTGNVGSQGSQNLKATGGSMGAVTAPVAGTLHGSVMVLTSASALTFATVYEDQTPPTVSWTFRNDGDASMTLSPATLKPPFGVGTNGCVNIAAGQSCSLTVSEATGSAGTFSQTAISVSGASQGARSDLQLTGTVKTRAVVTATPTSLDFGSVRGGYSKALTTTLKNTSTFAVTGLSASLDYTLGTGVNGGYGSNLATACGSTLAAGASCTVTITFESGCQPGGRNATFTILGTNAESVPMTLTGTTGTKCS